MKIEKIRLDQLKDNDYLWRYLSLSKFVNFALSNSLNFSRLDKFEDPYEGITQQMLWERMESKMSDDGKLGGYQKRNFVNCWFTGNRESVAMWNLYAGKDGVAIRIKKKELVRFLDEGNYVLEYKNNMNKMIVGMVEYKDFRDPACLGGRGFKQKYSSLRKDLSFAHENELRIVLQYGDLTFPEKSLSFAYPNIKLVFNNPSDFKADVVLNPRMSIWEGGNIDAIISQSKLSLTREFSELRLN